MAGAPVRLTNQWVTREVGPGTPYEDDPALQVPTGWYVLGGVAPGLTKVAVHIHHAFDENDEPVEEFVANVIASALRAATWTAR